jgi:uncharacterized protein YdhG (YjbR/CyaY superfamily)
MTGMPTPKKSKGFTNEERAAMRARAKELKVGKADGESEVLAKIAAMSEPDRALAKRVHGLVRASAPSLMPKTWYGMPAYADGEGSVVCHFQPAEKFKTRYASLGFSDKAHLDEGNVWPNSFALKGLTAVDEAKISALLKKAVG